MTAIQFLDLLRRSQLLDEQEVRKFVNSPGDGEELAATMVKAGLLTEWQAEKLLAGKFKGFMLGNYTLLSYRGKNGMSQDYVALHRLMKRKVILEILPIN